MTTSIYVGGNGGGPNIHPYQNGGNSDSGSHVIPSSIGASSHHSPTTPMIGSGRIIPNHHRPLHRCSGS